MLCTLGSHHVHRDKIRKYIKCLCQNSRNFYYSNINVLCIYVFYLYEYDAIQTCIAFTDSPVKRPENDLYVGRNM